jgi:hypothetical protein
MEDYEKLGVFYLGRQYDLKTKKSQGGGLILYDSKDLVTHAVCVGMTGSGKTGLCIGLLEEAAIDNIPAIVIDPKGDLTNLMLTFPELRADDFLPWVNEDDARKKNLSVQDYAKQQADLWKNGLSSWTQDGERIKRLKEAADFVIYTPGSTAGIPVSILKSFAAPPQAIIDDDELLKERINSTATSLLGLIGIDADPIRSREHILISTILNSAWKSGSNLDLAGLIQSIQTPPINKVGVLDLDSFYPAKDRFALALSLNNLLAAPGFSTWLEGEALDIGALMYSRQGKPRVSIFSIAHLSDAERMFFVSLLLNQTLGWMRTQSGTSSLRAIVYMDEIFGYFPPVANPPSKAPLLTLLKQARAFGVGVVLVTQNPVDLDYKGLSNTGTWFIGRLQTERDKARVLDGLEGAAAGTGAKFDRQGMEQLLAGLSSRVFLLNNAKSDQPVVFETRWAMSYLTGPMTRNQIKKLMDPVKANYSYQPAPAAQAAAQPAAASIPAATPPPQAAVKSAAGSKAARPVLPPDIPQYFGSIRSAQPANQSLTYKGSILGVGQVHFSDVKTGIEMTRDATYKTDIIDDPIPVNWDNAVEFNFNISDLEKTPVEPANFAELPGIASKAASYTTWNRNFATYLYRVQKLDLLKSPSLKKFSTVGESERDFRIRLQQMAREQRDAATDALRKKYETKMASLQEQLRRSQQVVERESEQAKQAGLQTAISLGATVLGAFLGGSGISGTIGRASTTARGVSRSVKEKQDIDRAKETSVSIQERLRQMEADFKADAEALAQKMDPLTETLETISVKPAKTDITIRGLYLCWLPYWQNADGRLTQAW